MAHHRFDAVIVGAAQGGMSAALGNAPTRHRPS